MEVACGEHGDYVQKLVIAVNAGRCAKFSGDINSSKIISNDIAKETTPMKAAVGDAITVPNGSLKPPTTPATCTTSLLDSSENLPQSEKSGKTYLPNLLSILIYAFNSSFLWSHLFSVTSDGCELVRFINGNVNDILP